LFFVTAALVLAIFAVGFTRMAQEVTDAGAFYDFIRAGLGRALGRGSATLALVSYALLFVALVAYLGATTGNIVEYFTGNIAPWWLWSTGWLLITGLLGYRDIALSTKVLGVSLVLEVAIMLVLNGVIIVRGGAEGTPISSLNALNITEGTPSLGLMFAFFGFIGFEATVIFRSEARDPQRTIPRATYLSIAAIGIFYAVSLYAVTVGAGNDLLTTATDRPQNLVSDLALTFLGVFGENAVQLLVIVSLFGCLLTFHNVLARFTSKFGAAGLLPVWLGHSHPGYRSPSNASMLVTALGLAVVAGSAVLGVDPVLELYTWFSGAATLGIVVLMALTSLSVITYFRGKTDRPWLSTFVAPAVSLVAFTGLAILVIKNFPGLVGGSAVAVALLTALGVALVAGSISAVIDKSHSRDL